MDLNPYQSPTERGPDQTGDFRPICGWCAWAMFAAAALADLALLMRYLNG